MATLNSSSLVYGMSGSMGGLIFRQMNGKTIVSVKPPPPRNQSETQRKNRDKFRQASAWAKRILKNHPEKKSYYQQIAKKLNLLNAYTAAICEYMRKAKPKVVTHSSFAAQQNTVHLISLNKPTFRIRKISAMLFNKQGVALTEQVIDRYDQQKNFHFQWAEDLPDDRYITIVTDEAGLNRYTLFVSDIIRS